MNVDFVIPTVNHMHLRFCEADYGYPTPVTRIKIATNMADPISPEEIERYFKGVFNDSSNLFLQQNSYI